MLPKLSNTYPTANSLAQLISYEFIILLAKVLFKGFLIKKNTDKIPDLIHLCIEEAKQGVIAMIL